MKKNCKHCDSKFKARRKNHLYCTPSCKTLASYERNNYKYVPGHYKKNNDSETNQLAGTEYHKKQLQVIEEKLNELSKTQEKLSSINSVNIANSAIGTATADAAIYSLKKVFAPKSMPATKADIDNLMRQLQELKKELVKPLPTYHPLNL